MPVTRSQTRRSNTNNTNIDPANQQPQCRRSQRIMRAVNIAVELAPAPLPPVAPLLRRSKRLQGRSPSPPPPMPPPRARALAHPPSPAPPPVVAPPPRWPAPQAWFPAVTTTYQLREPLPRWPLLQQQHWSWAIRDYNVGIRTDELSNTTNYEHLRWTYHYPLTPANHILRDHNPSGPSWGWQPTVDEAFLWDMI